jgi:hypothetical protein
MTDQKIIVPGVSKPNGKAASQSPWQQLSNACYAIATARNKTEASVRLKGALGMVRAFEQSWHALLQSIASRDAVLCRLTNGTLATVRVQVEDPRKLLGAGLRICDSNGESLPIIDPQNGIVLMTPPIVPPLHAIVRRDDGTVDEYPVVIVSVRDPNPKAPTAPAPEEA